MRYRRFTYRYAEIVAASGPQLLGEAWSLRQPVVLARPQWRPPADLYETADSLVVKVEVSGMDEEDFDVAIYPDALLIEGVRRCDLPPGEMRYLAAEVRYGPFRLEVPLPTDVDREGVAARYDRGFLYVMLPKER